MYRVMIVDDDKPFCDSLQTYDWSAYDCTCVYAAYNGEEALAKCAEMKPHIVITDVNMPVMDGISLLRKLNEKYPEICVILLTVHKDFECAYEAVKLNACDYIVKDMNYRQALPDVLKKAIKTFEKKEYVSDRMRGLLLRQGVLLKMQTEDTLKSCVREADEFFGDHYGMLLTVDPENNERINEIIQQIDGTGILIDGKVSIIEIGEGMEIIVNDPDHGDGTLFNGVAEILIGMNVTASFCICGATVRDYLEAHRSNLTALERRYYTKITGLIDSGEKGTTPCSLQEQDKYVTRICAKAESMTGLSELIETEVYTELSDKKYKPDDVIAIFDRCLRYIETRFTGREDAGAHRALRTGTLRGTVDAFLSAASTILKESKSMSLVCEKALIYMKQELSRTELTLTDVAEHVFISPGYLSKQLKIETGSAFQELLTRLRMEKAVQLMKEGRVRVYEAALLCGYGNYRSFSAAFKAYYGISTKQYLKKVGQ